MKGWSIIDFERVSQGTLKRHSWNKDKTLNLIAEFDLTLLMVLLKNPVLSKSDSFETILEPWENPIMA